MNGVIKRSFLVLILLTLMSSHGRLIAADGISFVSAHIPPFSIKDETKCGFVCEIVAEMADRVGVPWRLTYAGSVPEMLEITKTKDNTFIFPLARTKGREDQYTWVQEILEVDVLFASAPGSLKIKDLDQAKEISAIGVRKGFAAKRLKKLGFTNLFIVKTSEANARALAMGNIEAWYAPKHEILYTWQRDGSGQPLVLGHKTHSIRSYLAASKSSPAIDLTPWREAFAKMKAEGKVKTVIDQYIVSD